MKKHSGGITSYLNQTTQKAIDQTVTVNQIVDIDIKLLETNTSNFYGLRDLESLAGMIATSGYINPLEVKQLENGKFKIISGHRRHAAISMLIEKGERIDPKIPCIVRDFEAKGPLSADEIERCYLIFSNRGQRQFRTVSEKLEEIRLLEPIAHKIWEAERKNGAIEGNFRSYFADELNMSSTSLHRLLSLNKLVPRALKAVDDQLITETTAAKLATLSEEVQNLYLDKLEAGQLTSTLRDIEQMIEHSKEENDSSKTDAFEKTCSEESSMNSSATSPNPLEEENHHFTKAEVDSIKSTEQEGLSEKDLEAQGQKKLFQQKENVQDEGNVESPLVADEKNKSQLEMKDILPKFDDADKEADSWVLQGLSGMMEEAIKMIALEKAKNNEKAAAQWDVRRAKVALVMAVLNE